MKNAHRARQAEAARPLGTTPWLVANAWLEGTYSELLPGMTENTAAWAIAPDMRQ